MDNREEMISMLEKIILEAPTVNLGGIKMVRGFLRDARIDQTQITKIIPIKNDKNRDDEN